MFHGVIYKITLAQFFWDTVYISASYNAQKFELEDH